MDDERRFVRNEKQRRRRALAFACKRLPLEIEREVFSYMKNPHNGRIDVSMSFQKAPSAKLLWRTPAFLYGPYFTDEGCNHGDGYITHLVQKISRIDLYRYYIRECVEKFTRHMQRTIADRVFKLVFSDVLDTMALYAESELMHWLEVHNNVPWPVATTKYNSLIEWREWLGIDQEKWEKRLPSMQTSLNTDLVSQSHALRAFDERVDQHALA